METLIGVACRQDDDACGGCTRNECVVWRVRPGEAQDTAAEYLCVVIVAGCLFSEIVRFICDAGGHLHRQAIFIRVTVDIVCTSKFSVH